MKMTIEKIICGLILVVGFAFLMPHKAEAATTGFPDDWRFHNSSHIVDGNVKNTIVLDGYSGTSSTVIIEGPVEYHGVTYDLVISGYGSLCGNNECVREIITRGKVYADSSSTNGNLWIFRQMENLTSVDLRHLDLEYITSTAHMFSECKMLRTVTLGGDFNTGNVTNMSNMFYACSSLQALDFSKMDTSSCTDMSSMFAHCSGFQTLNLGQLNTSSCTDMSHMFYNCSSLRSITFGGSFDTSQVSDLSYMFYACSSLESLDLSSFDVTNAISQYSSVDGNMSHLVDGCSSLKSIDLSSFDMANGTYSRTSADFLNNAGLNSLTTIKTPYNLYLFYLPRRQIKENGEWVTYRTKWKDSSGDIYEICYPLNEENSPKIEQSVTLTYVGLVGAGTPDSEYVPPSSGGDSGGSASGGGTAGGGGSGNSGGTHSLPNTAASDQRDILIALFLGSLMCSIIAYGFKRKYR